jgi:hypothetical protein
MTEFLPGSLSEQPARATVEAAGVEVTVTGEARYHRS